MNNWKRVPVFQEDGLKKDCFVCLLSLSPFFFHMLWYVQRNWSWFLERPQRGEEGKKNKKQTKPNNTYTEPKKNIRMYLLEIVYRVQYMCRYVMSGRSWKEIINMRPSMSKAPSQKVTEERIHSCGTDNWEDEDC